MGVLCGCSIFPARPAPNFFVLSSEADTPESNMNASRRPGASLSPIQLGLGPIRFPDYLDRLEVVTRIDENRVAISETDRWAAPLGSAFTRVLAQDLSARVPDSHVALYPWYQDNDGFSDSHRCSALRCDNPRSSQSSSFLDNQRPEGQGFFTRRLRMSENQWVT